MQYEEPVLPIKTAFWRDGKLVKLNSAKDIDRAVGLAITNMRRNKHKADYVEVFDSSDADRLHCQVKRVHATGNIHIYERSKENIKADKFAATPLVQQLAKIRPLRAA